MPSPGRKELDGQVPRHLPPPIPQGSPLCILHPPHHHRLQFPVPTDMCRQHLWVGYQPDLVVVTDLCLSMPQARTPTTRQVLSASGTAPQGQLLWVGRRLPESSDTWGRRQVCLDPAPCSSSSASFPDAWVLGFYLARLVCLLSTPILCTITSRREGALAPSMPTHAPLYGSRASLQLLLTLSISFLLLGYPLQNSCLENPRDGGAWWAAVYGVAQSWTRLKRLSSNERSSQLL